LSSTTSLQVGLCQVPLRLVQANSVPQSHPERFSIWQPAAVHRLSFGGKMKSQRSNSMLSGMKSVESTQGLAILGVKTASWSHTEAGADLQQAAAGNLIHSARGSPQAVLIPSQPFFAASSIQPMYSSQCDPCSLQVACLNSRPSFSHGSRAQWHLLLFSEST